MSNIEIIDILGDGGAMSDAKDDYVPRPSQIEAAQLIDSSLQNNQHVILEAGCGFGKSFAYLISVVKNIAESNFKKKAVLVTSGISLQEQLFFKDVPFVTSVMKSLYPEWPTDFKVTLLKGRQNFICKSKMDELDLGKFSGISMLEDSFESIRNFYNETTTGDLSELDFVPDSKTLKAIACVESSDCAGRHCDRYMDCYYQKHKGDLAMSNIIVTNYHMLFSDYRVGGHILPEYDILVFDEAHELANIFREFQSNKVNIHTFNHIRNKLSEIANKDANYKRIILTDIERLLSFAETFFNSVESMHSDNLKSPYLITSQDQLPSVNDIVVYLGSLDNCMRKVVDTAEQAMKLYDKDSTESATQASILSIANSILESKMNIVRLLSKIDIINEDKNNVVWIEKHGDVVSINEKQVDVGDAIKEAFFMSEHKSCILTSATISVSNSFEYLKEQIGIHTMDSGRIIEFIGDSPFDLTEQQLWYLPSNAIDGNKFGFDNELPNQIKEIVIATGGGVLGLFTSVKNMRNCYYELSRSLPSHYRILMQGDMPRTKLLEEFKNDKDSILLGTKSFFTGIDVPGDALRCVVIDKFPFPQPTDPVQQKLKERSNAFYRYSIPEMIISLKQAVGRGVRSISDRCVICILDGRMSTAKYKGRINSSFNYKKTGTRDIDAVREYINNK